LEDAIAAADAAEDDGADATVPQLRLRFLQLLQSVETSVRGTARDAQLTWDDTVFRSLSLAAARANSWEPDAPRPPEGLLQRCIALDNDYARAINGYFDEDDYDDDDDEFEEEEASDGTLRVERRVRCSRSPSISTAPHLSSRPPASLSSFFLSIPLTLR
jgi:hypothetical protein